MATYDQYPTPPPTSSPKHTTATYHPFSPKLPAQETYYQETAPLPYTQSSKAPPAQETYYKQSYSDPSSPLSRPIQPTTQKPGAATYEYEYLPPRRKSSPIQNLPPKASSNPYITTASPRPFDPYTDTAPLPQPPKPQPQSRPSSRTKTRTPPPRPLYFSPTNPPPTPYNTSRPLPRRGFLSRILSKLRNLLSRFTTWSRKNPIKAGLATFLPILASAGLIRAGKALGLGAAFAGIGKVLGSVGGGLMEGMGGGKFEKEGEEVEAGGKKGVKKLEKEVEKDIKKEFGWGMDHFVGFGGTKEGPLDGIMKILLMGVNHYCKLSPSAVPRAASILLELYFLERKK